MPLGQIIKTHNIQDLKKAIMLIENKKKHWNHMKQNCLLEAKKYLPSYAMKKLIDKVRG